MVRGADWAIGGTERHLMDYFAQIDYDKHRVTLVAIDDVFSERIKQQGFPVEIVHFPFAFGGTSRAQFQQMFRFLRILRPDAICYVNNWVLQFTTPQHLAGFIAAKGNIFCLEVIGAPQPVPKTSKKYFGFIPGLGLWWYKRILPVTLCGWIFRRILAVSEEVKERLVKLYFYPKNRITVQYHGADTKQFFPDRDVSSLMRKKLGIPEKDTVIISVARFVEVKRVDRLINAFADLHKTYKHCWLILVGDGPLQENLEKSAEKGNVRDRVKFLGYQEKTDSYLKMSDIFVLPSDNEGFPRATLEAMATGLISVLTCAPGASEIVQDGYNGILVERSEEGVREGLRRALSLTEEQKQEMSQNTLAVIKEKYTLEKNVKDSLAVLGLSGLEIAKK